MATRIKLNRAVRDRILESREGPVARELLRRGLQVERTAKRLAPVDTGRLRSSINTALAVDSRGLFARIGTNVDYALYVELGTLKQPAQPYLRPALAALR